MTDQLDDSPRPKRKYTKRSKKWGGKRKSTMKQKRGAHAKEERQIPLHELREHISYIYGRIEVEIEHYSRSNNIPFSALAQGVAGLLRC